MTDVPETMRALESAESGAPISALRVVDNRPTPRAGTASSAPASLKPVLVKVEWAAVQNVDNYLLAGYLSSKVEWPFVTGVEFAGTIAEVCDGSRWKVGDRVWGCTSLGYAGSGTLAEYCSTAEDLVGALPAGVPMEQAATLCCTGMTAAAGIWDLLQLDKEYKSENAKTCVVVYGAGTSVGQYGVQLAKVAGYHVIAIASKKHHTWLTGSLGADSCVDYNDPQFIEQLAADPSTKQLAHVFDCAGKNATSACFDILKQCSGKSGKVASVLHKQSDEMKLKPKEELGLVTHLTDTFVPERKPYVDAMAGLSMHLQSGKLVLNRVRKFEGLEAGKDALQFVADGKVSGEKIVVHVTA